MSWKPINRTQVILQRDGFPRADVLASCKVEGYVFLIHRAHESPDRFTATYAPTGLNCGRHESIEAVIAALFARSGRIIPNIAGAILGMESQHLPMLSPETGIQSFCWRYREQCRFDSGEYRPVPEVLGTPYPAEHYLHLSVTKTECDFVAYTPSEAYGAADRQVRLKFGKYLRKTFQDMSDAEIQNAVTELRARLELQEEPAVLLFATDRDTINQIFETRMYACDSSSESCMFNKFKDQEVRPYHVYADSPDVAVAYVLRYGNIVARSVVSTKNKKWVRPYSIEYSSTLCKVLEDLLESAGYSRGDLLDNRLTNLGPECIPYIDRERGLADEGRYWRVVGEGEGDYNADNTDGTGTACARLCERCERNEDDCECSYCGCCEESYYPSCDNCSFCADCNHCVTHEHCECERCAG